MSYRSVFKPDLFAGQNIIVTGGGSGIGRCTAHELASLGARVVLVGRKQDKLDAVAAEIEEDGGQAIGFACDIRDEDVVKSTVADIYKAVEVVHGLVNNAGITRDKTLGNMPEHFWDMTIAVNLTAEELIDEELMHQELLCENGRIVCISSISGIAGNFGQTNYSTAKCGVIGYVEAMAKQVKNGVTINAIAPGFIETQMTAAMPITIREAGRRMNSLSQGGLPVDVAEAIAWYCNPASNGVNGNVVRVCGQSLIGK
jgi:3-oxoacyl-[acyl-carrier protein] reductase